MSEQASQVLPSTGLSASPELTELQQVNERLLLASLREHTVAAQLHEQLALTNAITDSLPEAVMALEASGRIIFANPVAARLLDWPAAELCGLDIDALLPEVSLAGPLYATDGALAAALRTGTTYHRGKVRFVRRDGSTLPVVYTASPLVAAGLVVGTVVAFHAVIARQDAEREDAVRLAQVEAALAFRANHIAITAHELKTPLTIVKAYAQLLQLTSQVEALSIIVRQVERMTRLIDDLTEVARTTSAGIALTVRSVDLNVLLAETVAEVTVLAPTFALRLDQQARDLHISGDRARLQQVLLNLLTNAVKYSVQRREIDISLRRDGDRAVIAVTDYGRGIPPAEQGAVFEPYFRAANVTADIGGRGLGLFISKAIIDLHAGTIGLVSAEGAGTTFTVALPLQLPTAAVAW